MRDKRYYLLFIVAFLVVLFLMSRSYSYAKYASNSVWNYYLQSRGFYLESDDISLGNVDNNWDGGSINFSFKNYVNDSDFTNHDITYKVTCTVLGDAANYSSCYLNGSSSNTYTGTLSGSGKAIKNDYFDIVSGEEITGLSVEIKLESLTPYKKTITGEYILNKGTKEIGELKLNYNSSDDRVVITNSYNENKCVKLSWDSSKIRIDNNKNISSSNSDDDGYIKEIIFNIKNKDSLDFIFYRIDSDVELTNNDFTLVESNECY